VAVDDLVDDLAGELRALGRAGWGATPRHTAGPAGRFAGLLSTARLAQLTGELPRGAPLLLAGLDESWPPAGRLCQELSRRSGLAVSAVAVASPAGVAAAGSAARPAGADHLVLQCVGGAAWTVWPPDAGVLPPLASPAPGPPVDAEVAPGTVYRRRLAAGDSLYVPRGSHRRSEAGSGLSVHVTLVLGSLTLAEVAEQAARDRGAAWPPAAGTLPPFWFEDPARHLADARRVTDAVLAGAASAVTGELAARAERLRRAVAAATGEAPGGSRPGAR